MAGFDNSLLMELLEAISRINLDDDRLSNASAENNNQLVCRGKPSSDNTRRTELQNVLIARKRNKTINDKIDALKVIVQEKDEKKGVTMLASYINEILDPVQMYQFISELNGYSNGTSDSNGYHSKRSEYIPILPQEGVVHPHKKNSGIVARSGEPQNSINQGSVFDSIQEGDVLKLPLECHYNASEIYIIHKGIYFSRVSMARKNSLNDDTIIRELESKNLLNVVLNERINNENNYLMTLVENYPRSLEEIKFLLSIEKELILKSSIFVYLAQKNIQHLYEFLVLLSKNIDKNVLSRACDSSLVNGVNVLDILQQNLPSEVRTYADKITRFLNRHKPSYPS